MGRMTDVQDTADTHVPLVLRQFFLNMTKRMSVRVWTVISTQLWREMSNMGIHEHGDPRTRVKSQKEYGMIQALWTWSEDP